MGMTHDLQPHSDQPIPQPKSRRFPHQAIAVALVLFSFFMTALVSRTVFERLPHLEDEVAYLYQARTLAGGQLVVETPQPVRTYWQPFVISEDGLTFGKYTLGWPLQLAVGVLMGQAWVLNAFFAALTVALVYRLAREIFNPDAGVIAAALTAFSPMALLLNGTLMGHTAALFAATLFVYAYWRITRERHMLRWGLLAGLALGLLVANRPLSAAGVAIPFIVWSLIRLGRALTLDIRWWRTQASFKPEQRLPSEARFLTTLRPLIALGTVTLLLSTVIPIYNYAATGDPTTNLYTMIWSYDRVGFGEDYGRNTHRLDKAYRHARFDLSLMAADLFGWQIGEITPELQDHLRFEGDYWPPLGLSWVLLPFGLIVGAASGVIGWRRGLRSVLALALWIAVGAGWLLFPMVHPDGANLRDDPAFSWLWLIVAFVWGLLPLIVLRRTRFTWTWLLALVALSVIGVHVTYWIGSQRYSTRYYFDGLTALAILSALPLAWLARRQFRSLRWIVYGGLALALIHSLYNYSTPRITALYQFNNVTQAHIDAVQARRTDDRPLLVIINGRDVRWRAFGSLMAVTSPYLDSDIVAAWNYWGDERDHVREQIFERFPDRAVIEMEAEQNRAWFRDEPAVSQAND
ncbi:MAG: hypothetical protein GYB67_11400 [Chloroflexi bacterium]|nr:hypothetical protein [Chloroflexota bacterium]